MHLVDHPTRLLFFTGKGGVGKTSLACATAVALADRGKRVLLVSTDPASNLGQVFGFTIGESEPTPVPGVPRLSALNINPEAAARAYRDRLVGPVRGVLPAETVKAMEEQLSGACTTEIAAFDEFTGLLERTGPGLMDKRRNAGATSSIRRQRGLLVWAHSPAWKSSDTNTPMRWRRSPTRKRRRSSSWPVLKLPRSRRRPAPPMSSGSSG